MTDTTAGDRAGRVLLELDRAESLRLLAGVPVGRVVFTRNALPDIRPVNHLVDDDGTIVVRTRITARFTSAIRGNSPVVVAYEADDIDPVRRVGWSVVVTGFARPVTDRDRIARYEGLLHSWVDKVMDTVIAIEPEIVTGIRLAEKRT
ncbi:pyridoxamine 5'-phosphate oxidase family protein [Nocardia mexicana]|uniref:Pyridoxamine 5'-phosphate oxidase-like protein n=1 Tax=Nocardia mexicana TaxID=279262 RepID=A0A370HDG9_9NOCA|nr:pyridoxamine 5'-phosphate oxidase family protein [Nocardia mexicana]RDI55287.1 pyridoxamine 5'-phosphate oxidase-like protein [Nocardia mexicana]